jgi:uncharacterized NAD-dependent epimerase/dehydratase family protein
MVSTYEQAAALLRPAKVACVTVNCQHLDDDGARAEIERIEDSTGLPAGDVLRGDAAKLWAAVSAALPPRSGSVGEN